MYLPTVLSKVDNFLQSILWAPLGLSYTEVQEGFKCSVMSLVLYALLQFTQLNGSERSSLVIRL